MKQLNKYILEKLKIRKSTKTNIKITDSQHFIDVVSQKLKFNDKILDLSNFDFSKYSNNYIPALMNIDTIYQVESIDISNWKLGSNINTLQQLFCNLDSLTEIIGFDTIDFSNIVSIESLFQGTGLTEFDYTNISFPKLKRAENLFAFSNDLEYINISNWEVPQLGNCARMFAQCPKLTTVEGLNTWNKTSIIECKYMFFSCKSLKNINVNGFDVSQLKGAESMFEECSSLKSINISNWDFENVYIMERMFKGCINLETVGTFPNPQNNKNYFYNCKEMFYDCEKLKLDLSNITIIHRGRNQNFSKGTDPKLFKRPKFKV